MKPAIKAHLIIRAATFTLAALGIGLLQGCGGSSSSPSAPAAPTLSWSAQQTKTFHFTWSDVSGETEYRLLENPDGASGFTQVGSAIAADSTSYDLVVSLHKRINAQYMLQSCNDTGCTDSNVVSIGGTLAEGVGYFKATNVVTGERFGYEVAFSGDGTTLAVGVPYELSTGTVYLFRNDNGSWVESGYVKASNAELFDLFGTKVALSADGTILAVGADYEDGNATGVNTGAITETAQVADSGAVYLFSNDGSSSVWTEDAYIKAPTPVTGAQFGVRLALTANATNTTQTLAVGGGFQSGGNGAVYLFSNDGTGWVAGDILTASNGGADDCFGCQISLTTVGTTMIMAVGAHLEDGDTTGVTTGAITETTSVSNSGAVYLFSNSFNGSAWTGWNQDAYIKASNTGANDLFGSKVALSADGTTLAVGAFGEGENVTGVHVGDYTTNADGASGSGAVYLFNNSGSGWAQTAYIKASNTGGGDDFGRSVALSADGSTLAVGANHESENVSGVHAGTYSTDDNLATASGAVYLYSNSGGSWVQQAYIKASNTGNGDQFGCSVALSPDGDTLAVGAEYEQSAATGINSTETGDTGGYDGAVYLY